MFRPIGVRSYERMFGPEAVRKLPTETLEAEIATLYSKISAETCRWLLLVAELDRREAHLQWGCRSCADWLSWHCGIAVRAAQDHVRVARRLEELPATTAAFARGQLSYSKVRALTRVADGDSEERLLGLARDATAAQLERIVSAYRRATTAADPDAVRDRRYASFTWGDDGCLEVRARLAPEEGAIVMKAIELARDELFRERGAEAAGAENGDRVPARPARTTNADAFLRLAESAVAASDSRANGGDATQVVVHVEAAELQQGEARPDHERAPGRCELEAGPGVHTGTARRLACDASVVTLHERNGEPLSVGRRTRSIPPAVRRALRARDGGCRFPGCNADRFIDAHHVEHWADGGKTDLGNLITLCRHHHRLVHEGGFRLEARADGEFVFRRRNGSALPASPALPGSRPGPRLLRDAIAGTPSPGARLLKPLGPCAPPHGRTPLDLDLTLLCALQDENPERRSRSPGRSAVR